MSVKMTKFRQILFYSSFRSVFTISLQAALKKSNLELEAELKLKLNNTEMLNEGTQMKDKIIKVILKTFLD